MAGVVHWVGVTVDEVVAASVVPIQVRMSIVNPCVDDGNFNAGSLVAAIVNDPGTDALHSPGFIQLGIYRTDLPVKVDGRDFGVSPQSFDSRLGKCRRDGGYQMVGIFNGPARTSDQTLFGLAGLAVKGYQDGYPGSCLCSGRR
jgi:hypothetical protein